MAFFFLFIQTQYVTMYLRSKLPVKGMVYCNSNFCNLTTTLLEGWECRIFSPFLGCSHLHKRIRSLIDTIVTRRISLDLSRQRRSQTNEIISPRHYNFNSPALWLINNRDFTTLKKTTSNFHASSKHLKSTRLERQWLRDNVSALFAFLFGNLAVALKEKKKKKRAKYETAGRNWRTFAGHRVEPSCFAAAVSNDTGRGRSSRRKKRRQRRNGRGIAAWRRAAAETHVSASTSAGDVYPRRAPRCRSIHSNAELQKYAYMRAQGVQKSWCQSSRACSMYIYSSKTISFGIVRFSSIRSEFFSIWPKEVTAIFFCVRANEK